MIKVAILIPTMNRSEFLIRQLWYYVSLESPHPVYIGDASNKEQRERLETGIKTIGQRLTIHYHHWPEKNDRQTISQLGEIASEPFCAFIGDDDFFIPDSLSKCAEYLDKNKEYRTAQGKAILFSLKESGPLGIMNDVSAYWNKIEAEEETGVDRLSRFVQNYWVPQFSVHRRNEFIEDSIQYKKIADKSFGEALHSFTFICKGKSKFIDCLYMIRQTHEFRYILPNIFEWLTDPNWQPSYWFFLNSLTKVLMETDGISKEAAEDAIKHAFCVNLTIGLTKTIRSNNTKLSRMEYLKQLIKTIPGAKVAVNKVRFMFYCFLSDNEMTLPRLLNQSSTYHQDFLPAYKAITQSEK